MAEWLGTRRSIKLIPHPFQKWHFRTSTFELLPACPSTRTTTGRVVEGPEALLAVVQLLEHHTHLDLCG